jgi:hypothetical protein
MFKKTISYRRLIYVVTFWESPVQVQDKHLPSAFLVKGIQFASLHKVKDTIDPNSGLFMLTTSTIIYPKRFLRSSEREKLLNFTTKRDNSTASSADQREMDQ